ncbi:unnamed protein product [Camellia sinensis]
MDSTGRRSGGLVEGLYKVLMRRTSVYATFVIAGAFLGERVVDYGVHKLWEYNNVGRRGGKVENIRGEADGKEEERRKEEEREGGIWGKKDQGNQIQVLNCQLCEKLIYSKRYEDIPVLGQRPTE